MKLYDYTAAPNPKRARMALFEKNITDIEIVQIDLRKMEQLSDDFRQINPRCTVPVLECDDGTMLTENIAIADYLENHYPEPPLLGSNAYERAQVFTWNAICEAEGFMPIAEVFRNGHPAFENRALPGTLNIPQLEALVERGQLRIDAFFPKLEQQLSQQQYLVSGQFTYADITAFVFFEFLSFAGLTVPTDYPNINRWRELINQRPSSKA